MNVSSLISPGLTKTLTSTGLPNAFGDQVKEAAKKKVISAALGQAQILQQKLEDIIKKKLELEVTHKSNLNKLENQYQPKPPAKPTLTEEEYKVAVANENVRYAAEKESLNKQQQDTESQIQSINKDPKKSKKDKQKKQKDKQKRKDIRNKANKTKAISALLSSTAKSFAPLLILSGTILISKLAVQNSSLRTLVDKTNDIIDNAQTPEQLDNARASRNSAYNVLDSNEKTFIRIQESLQIIQIIITVTQILIPLLFLSPAPPLPLIEELQKKLSLAQIVLATLTALLIPIINELTDLKSQLKVVDNKLDINLIDSTGINALDNLNALLNSIKQPKDEIYKGFRLRIKEDQDPRTFVRDSIKRHYAAAFDRDNVEVIKSDYSYTLEPQILIDQLKVIIDQRNLQA